MDVYETGTPELKASFIHDKSWKNNPYLSDDFILPQTREN